MKIVLKVELADAELRAIEFDRSRKFRKPTKLDVKNWLILAIDDEVQKALHNYLDDPDVRKKRAKARINAQAKANGGSFWSSNSALKMSGTVSALELNAATSGEEN